uniref:Retrotransposon gag domain-containing protein n=1 Tax=Chromera velia CCMP2878 TaxID=1169474 RepID=A0A0G4HDM3_9ALVE|eukprot:Cvel_26561.t1-p1 / transcript=Cvel_26561.t1 / gene=Cvel_26561 / organism=Chromera_velia_CCMP2878 / gene_product=hypothetical protein / transcript_product=hypothetical protein / location=Cvel_scaffold3179:13164-14914(-) / protein_length=482 / sequence_SO=supercontig / SO=protein_coding / is_pseudo=false
MREYIQLSDIQVSKQLGSVRQYFSRFLKQWYDKTQRSASPFISVEDLFTRLSKRFPDPNKQTDLRGEVRNVCCQGNEGVHKYSVRFNDIAEGIVDVSEIDLMYDYIRGLPDEVRKEVRRRKPDSLDAAMKDAEEAEQLLSGGRKKDYGGQGTDGRRAVGESSHPAGAYASPWTVPTTAVLGEPSPVVTAPAAECTPERDVLHDWGQDRQEGEIDYLPRHSEWHPDPCPLGSVSKRVVETGEFHLSALEPSTCKGGIRLDGAQAPSTTVQWEAPNIDLRIQDFAAPLTMTVFDLDEDYDMVLGIRFCETFKPLPNFEVKSLFIAADRSPSGSQFTLYDLEVYHIPGAEPEPLTHREIRRLSKKESTTFWYYRFEVRPLPSVSSPLEVNRIQGAETQRPPPLSSFPPDHPVNSDDYTDFRREVQEEEIRPRMRKVLEKHFSIFPNEIPTLPPKREVECHIKLEPGHRPPARAPYRLTYRQLDEL